METEVRKLNPTFSYEEVKEFQIMAERHRRQRNLLMKVVRSLIKDFPFERLFAGCPPEVLMREIKEGKEKTNNEKQETLPFN